MAVDGMAAARTLLSYSSVQPGYCLKYVWQAYKANGAVSDGLYYPTAYSAWQQTAPQFRHEGDRNPPPGVPVYWGPKSSSSAGDIVISMGNQQVAATDWPYGGVTGQTTIDARQNQIQRPYLGWTEVILGFPVQINTPISDEEEPMILNIQGQSGVRNGGAYYVSGNSARFIGGNVAGAPTLTFDQGTALLRGMSVS